MSAYDADHLYSLLPAVYRLRDEEQGKPLRELVEILAGQAGIVEQDVARLADDWFIETCQEWVIPYIGDLLGIEVLGSEAWSPRAEVAHTLGYRRRKGTAAVLEQLARDVTGWPALAVEMFRRLATTQHLGHLRPENRAITGLRDPGALELLDGPFDATARTVEVRRIPPRRGRYNLPNLALFLWRLQACPLDGVTPCVQENVGGRFTFNPLGLDEPLFHRGEPPQEGARVTEIHRPGPIRRRVLDQSHDSFDLFTLDSESRERKSLLKQAVAADLSEWNPTIDSTIHPAWVSVDPVLGRILFAPGSTPPDPFLVSYCPGFSAPLGGGPYEREASFRRVADEVEIPVAGGGAALADALENWDGKGSAVIVIEDSRTYEYGGDKPLHVEADARLEIRAANEQRPLLRLRNALRFSGGPSSEVELNGLLIDGFPVEASGDVNVLRVRHCTVRDGLIAKNGTIEIMIDRSIVGPVQVSSEARVKVSDSILDGKSRGTSVFEEGQLTLSGVTVIGTIQARELPLVENSILLGTATAEQRQAGCVRFSWIAPESRVPRRHQCQPAEGSSASPVFNSLCYGDPRYAQLALATPDAIRRGAEDGSEMGAFSFLRQPQREDALRARLADFLPAEMEAGTFFVT